MALEGLEDRTLLSTLPSPVTSLQSLVGQGITAAPNTSSPSVAVDPLNPQKLIAAWTTTDPANKLDGPNGQVTTYVQGAFSLDGGQTWQELPGDLDVDIQTDFSQAFNTSGAQPNFAQTTDATVAFGRDEHAYILSSTHDAGSVSGVLDLQAWDFSRADAFNPPVAQTFARAAQDTLSDSFFGIPSTVDPIYRWQGADGAIEPTLAVDDNLPFFDDGEQNGVDMTQTDPFAGNVYVAWETQDVAPKGVTAFNPNTIKLMSSSDDGRDFTYQAYLTDHFQGDLYDQPKIAISQGTPTPVGQMPPATPTVRGGQVTIVYDNAGPGGSITPSQGNPYSDEVLTTSGETGGTDAHFNSPSGVPLKLASAVGTTTAPANPGVTPIKFDVNINSTNDPEFTTLQNLTLSLSLEYPTLANTGATLTAPDGTVVTLWNTATDNTGTATKAAGTLTGANVGAATVGDSTTGPALFIGTTLDSTALRSLFDGNVTAPYTGHFQPLTTFDPTADKFINLQTAFQGMTAGELDGTWTLTITDFQGDTATTPKILVGASLDFTSGLSDLDGTNPKVTPAITGFVDSVALNSGAHPFTDGIQAAPVLANPSIASDNTLGLPNTGANQGRIYVAVTNDDFNFTTGAYTTSTFIELFFSDDGGSTWNLDSIVNDDDGLTDGFSTAGYAQPGNVVLASQGDPLVEYFGDLDADVRPKIEPQVAVDQYTGTVVVSFLDTRNDASAVRVANYIAASTDGGASFAPEVYANPTTNDVEIPVQDAITGQAVILGPVPDNESSGNNNQETTFGFGQHQGLAVADGEIIPVWSSNLNEGSKTLNIKVGLDIVSAVVNYAAGPRVIASTQGPVGQPGDTVNVDREADGTPIADTIVITFDRPVDPASFLPDEGSVLSPLEVFYNNPAGGTPIRLPVVSVTPDSTDTVYTITFDPTNPATGLPFGVGTYSYKLLPLVRGMVPYQALLNVVQQVPFIDTAVNSGRSAPFTIASDPGVALTNAAIIGGIDVYDPGATPVNSPDDVQIFLVAQDGSKILLDSASTFTAKAGTVIPVDAEVTGLVGELLDQTYTILVVDKVPGENVFLFNDQNLGDFNFQVLLDVGLTTIVSGNLLDQDNNGVPGEQPGDDYSIPDGRDTLPLIVPGPHVSSTSVVGVNGTPSSGTDNLVNSDSVNSINVTFDRQMQVSSFTPAQVLSVLGPNGQINSPQTFTSTGIAKNFAYNGPFQLIPKAVATGTPTNLTSEIVIANTGALAVSSLTVQVNITDPNDQSLSLALEAPNGMTIQLVAAGTASGANFTNTVFSDTPPANGLTQTIPAGQAPYSLTYQPASPLTAIVAGLALQGTWKLIVTDSTTTGAQGRLNGWSLNIVPEVPEGAGTSFSSPLVIPNDPDGSFKIASLAVQLTIASTNNADLAISLVSPKQPNGLFITVPLVLAGSTSGQNFANTVFFDGGTIPIASGAAPYGLTYKPAGALAALDGVSINGTWTLVITNLQTDKSVTTLESWSLIATPQITVKPVDPVGSGATESATEFTIGFPTQTLSGTYTATLSPTIMSVAPNPADPSEGTPLDTNLNAGVDTLEGITTGPTTSDQFVATAVPVAIPYATQQPNGGAKVPGVLTSQIDVTDDFPVQGDVGLLAGLTVSLNIAYYYDSDLMVTLTAPGPNGRTITLFNGVGGTGSNFQNTTLSDTTTPLAPITAAGAPFFGTFNPENTLAGFTTGIDGLPQMSGGLWTLKITNNGTGDDHGVTDAITALLNSWSLNFQKPQVNTGLGEPVADQATVGFRIFNFSASNPLANDTWTAVGPAGTTAAANPNNVTGGAANGANLGGPVSVVAIDPADPSGNTAYVGAPSGGIWKTTDFLTTGPNGPTYVPLTDFGSSYTINIGGIAVFDRNNDPSQSIIFAGTGDGEATTANAGNAVQGVGILRSTNGGASFTLLDSSVNVDANGNPLPEDSPLRDHVFVGTTTYKIIVDPTPLPNGGVIVYAALGGPHGGLWRSEDGGNTWINLSQGVVPQVNGQNAAATDVLLDPASASPSTGNLDILYAAFEGVGVFLSSNQGLGLSEMIGNVGADNLIQDSITVPALPLKVNNVVSPNGAFGRIILAKPALTDNAAENILYQDWLYVAVENTNGTFNGLYVTKDRGENWTKAQLPSIPDFPAGAIPTVAEPTNDNLQANDYDVTNSDTKLATQNGNAAFSMAVDPTNPNIVYLGGTGDYQTSGLIRVDLTGLYDAHAYAPFADNLDDGGALSLDSNGRVNSNPLADAPPFFQGVSPFGTGTGFNYINLRHSPITINAFDVNSTQYVFDSTAFNNDGFGVKWTPMDTIYDSPLDGSSDIQQLVTMIDPLTGETRLIIADDQGVFTGVYNADGTLDTNGIGIDPAVTGSRNGNLQDEELYDTAAQPSSLAAQTAGALFYGSGIGMTDAQSDPKLLSDGNLTWTVQGVAYGDAQDVIETNDRGGSGIATDQTGGTTITNPIGTGPSVYEYDVPNLGGDATNFFRVNNSGQTTGLVNNYLVEWPGNNALTNGNGVNQLGNFAVNPLNGSQILISSNLGNVYETVNKGVQWLQIGAGQAVGSGVANFDGTYAAALAYGAPDPNAPGGLGNLNNFIYVGTIGTEGSGGSIPGHIYVSNNGGGTWTSISNGLDGSSIEAIYTNPNRGSHEAYAVTLKGVYYMTDSLAANATWVNITGNLFQLQRAAFGNAALTQAALLPYTGVGGQLGGLRSIVADYRYAVPDPINPGVTYPVLYVSGYGGVFRSLDNGQTWTAFPDTGLDSAPAEGGYLPNVDVTSLEFDLGAINPATGHATQDANDRELLLASTLGAGDYAIGLAPVVLPTTVKLDPASDTGATSTPPIPDVTTVVTPFIDGVSEISNFGNKVTIEILDETGGPGQGTVIGTGTTDLNGDFHVQLVNNGSDPTFFESSTSVDDKIIGVKAIDISGASGNITLFAYTLDTVNPLTPKAPVLEAMYDTGRSSSDDITNIEIPMPTPGSTPTFVSPVFDVTTTLPPANPLTPNPIGLTVELLRSTSPNGPFVVVGSAPYSTNPVPVTDATLVSLIQATMGQQINTAFYYEAEVVDQVGNASSPSGPLKVTVDTVTPPTLPAPTLDAASNTGLVPSQLITNDTMPFFDATGLQPGDQLLLYRSTGGAPLTLVGTAPVGVTRVQDVSATTPDGVYLYSVVQEDVAGNVSNFSPTIVVTISTTTAAAPTINLLPADDTGLPSHPNVTTVRTPRIFGTAQFNSPTNFPVDILEVTNGNNAAGIVVASTFPAANGTYEVAIASPLADGTYTLVARTRNLAGSPSYSAPLTITIKANGPQITPTLSILPADDTGIKGDGVTANHRPIFTGVTDPGDTVTLYAIVNGVLSAPQATTTSSTINGSFSIQLPFFLTDGTTVLVARTTDVAGNAGQFSTPLSLKVITVEGDYYDTGAAQLTIFDPNTESYYVRGGGSVSVDPTSSYRDIPVQYDFNGDGATDFAAYRFDSATYIGLVSTNSTINFQYGLGEVSLPTSGYFNPNGTFTFANFGANTAYWAVDLPQPGGLVVRFVVPQLDIPVPAAYDGNGLTEIAAFRPSASSPGAADADSFSVAGPVTAANPAGYYQVSFTNPAVTKLGFVYKAGDIPDPADYDGVGRDEFAIYRPTTGQFFILNTPNPLNTATWTLRTVTLNLPGGPNSSDVPVSEDYDGNGMADPTVYRPSNSTFYMIHSSTGLQENIPYGLGNFDIAAAGPLLYRLSALRGIYASNGGYPSSTFTGTTPVNGGGLTLHALAAPASPSASTSIPSTVAVAAPLVVTAPAVPSVSALISVPTPSAPVTTAPAPVAVTAPKSLVPTSVAPKSHEATNEHQVKVPVKAKKPTKAHAVETKAHPVEAKAHPVAPKVKVPAPKAKPATLQKHGAVAAAVTALQHLVMAKKGKTKA